MSFSSEHQKRNKKAWDLHAYWKNALTVVQYWRVWYFRFSKVLKQVHISQVSWACSFEILGGSTNQHDFLPWGVPVCISISASSARWKQEAWMLAKTGINKRNVEMNCSELRVGELRLSSNLMAIGWYSNSKCNIHVVLGIFSTGVTTAVHSRGSCELWCHY